MMIIRAMEGHYGRARTQELQLESTGEFVMGVTSLKFFVRVAVFGLLLGAASTR